MINVDFPNLIYDRRPPESIVYYLQGKSFFTTIVGRKKGLPMSTPKQFQVNEYVVYPGQGVAYIQNVITKSFAGSTVEFYELAFLNKDVSVLVPTHNADEVGLRHLTSNESIHDAFDILTQPAKKLYNYEFTATSWNRRNKDYQSKLQRGTLADLSEIYRDLHYISTQKALSFGEKTLLSQTEDLLAEEIAQVTETNPQKARSQLRNTCRYRIQSESAQNENQNG